MDPITQGALGAALPQSASRWITREPSKFLTLTWLAVLAGMAPDIDVLIRSPADPLLFLEFHRQFTHALIFIPVGSLVCALLAYPFARRTFSFQNIWLICALAYATHALLDACTTYGTQLFWPFSNERIAWNNVSVVDPLLTLPLLALVISTARTGKPIYARIGLAWVGFYLALGVVQHNRAIAAGQALALDRQHENVTVTAKPGFANLILWKTLYQHDGYYYVDAVRVVAGTRVYRGERAAILNPAKDLPFLHPASQQNTDLERFAWFSNNYLALDTTDPLKVIDMRYSMIPNEIDGLWGIRFDPLADNQTHVGFINNRQTSPQRLEKWMNMLLGL